MIHEPVNILFGYYLFLIYLFNFNNGYYCRIVTLLHYIYTHRPTGSQTQ